METTISKDGTFVTNVPESFAGTVTLTTTEENRKDLLCAALEGGSNYWYLLSDEAYDIVDKACPMPFEGAFVDRVWETLKAGKTIPIHDFEDETKIGELSLESIAKGEQLWAKKQPESFAALLSENWDANDADLWLQFAALGEVVYG